MYLCLSGVYSKVFYLHLIQMATIIFCRDVEVWNGGRRNRQYTVYCRKIYNLFVRPLETGIKMGLWEFRSECK